MDNKFNKVRSYSSCDPKYLYDGGELEITEKMDGANFSFYREKEGDPLTFRSRRQLLDCGQAFGKQWRKATEYIMQKDMQKPFAPRLIYFGECMKKHTINYGETPAFIGFAVRLLDDEEGYLEDWYQYYEEHDIPTVPRIVTNQISRETLVELSQRKSAFGTEDAQCEGVVVKNYRTNCFGEPPVRASMDNTEKIVNRWCTPYRICKGIHRLIDEHGYEFSMRMMARLPKDVMYDILEEHVIEMSQKYQYLHFKDMQGYITKRCAEYMKAATSQALGPEDILDPDFNRRMEARFNSV